jgi:hypothetical protein
MDAHMIAILIVGAAVLGVVVWLLAKIGQELETFVTGSLAQTAPALSAPSRGGDA